MNLDSTIARVSRGFEEWLEASEGSRQSMLARFFPSRMLISRGYHRPIVADMQHYSSK
jgi:hypothetical protein